MLPNLTESISHMSTCLQAKTTCMLTGVCLHTPFQGQQYFFNSSYSYQQWMLKLIVEYYRNHASDKHLTDLYLAGYSPYPCRMECNLLTSSPNLPLPSPSLALASSSSEVTLAFPGMRGVALPFWPCPPDLVVGLVWRRLSVLSCLSFEMDVWVERLVGLSSSAITRTRGAGG